MNCLSGHKYHCWCGIGFDDKNSLGLHKFFWKHQDQKGKKAKECDDNEIVRLQQNVEDGLVIAT